MLSKKVVILHSINYATLKSSAAVGKSACCANISTVMKNIFSRFLILFAVTFVSFFAATQSAWGADAVSATYTVDGQTHTWTNLSVTVTKGNALGGNGLYFVAGNDGDISSSKGVVNIKSGRTMYVQVPTATSTGTITIYAGTNVNDRYVTLNSGSKISMAKEANGGSSADFVAGDIENVNNGYYIKLASISDYKFVKIVVVLDAISTPTSSYCISVYNCEDASNDKIHYFTQAASESAEYIISDFTVPAFNNPTTANNYWVGESDAWSDAFSANAKFSDMPLTTNSGSLKLGDAAGAVGTLHIWDNNKTSGSNLWVKFTPTGYGLCWGTGTWNKEDCLPFSSADGITYTTDLVTLTADQLSSWEYYVGYKTADNYTFSSTNSETKGVNTMGVYNVTTTTWWDGNIGDFFVAGQKGKFRMWADNTVKNWNCHFIPYYTIVYNANYPAGASGQPADTYGDYVSLEESKTLTLPAAPAAPAGYQFKGWTAAQDGSGTLLAAGGPYDLNHPSANTTLYAQWEEIVEPTCNLYLYFPKNDDAIAAGVTNTDRFTGTASSSSNLSGSITIDGKTYNVTQRTSNGEHKITFVVGASKVATLYLLANSSGSGERKFSLAKNGGTATETGNSVSGTSLTGVEIPDLTAGEYILTASGNWGYGLLGLKECQSCTDAGLSFPKAAYSVAFGSAFTAPTLSQTTTATATYTSSNTIVATVDENTGAVTLVGEGTTTITASTPADGDYCAGEASYQLTVTLPACETPTISAHPVGGTYCAGEAITALSVGASVSDGGTLSYQWQKDGADISDSIKATYTPTEAGTYTCVVTNTLADHSPVSKTSDAAVITINAATAITTQPANTTVVAGAEATLTVTATGTGTLTYQWYTCASGGSSEAAIAGATTDTYKVTPDTEGTTYYKVTVTGTCGTATSDVATLTATSGPCFEMTKNATMGSVSKGTNTDVSSYFDATAGSKIAFTTTGSSREVTENGVKMDNNNDYFLITLPEGSTFAPGTTISFVVYAGNDNRGLTINSTATTGTRDKNNLISGSYTLPLGFVVTDSIKIYRAGGTVYMNSLTVAGCGRKCTDPQLTWSASSVEGINGSSFSFPTLNNPLGLSSIAYASSNTSVATVDTDGNVTIVGVGTTEISAAYAGADDTYCTYPVAYTLTVRCAVAPRIETGTIAGIDCSEQIQLKAVRSDNGNAYSNGTFQWYRDGTAIDGATAATYTATEAGTYTVYVSADGSCTEQSVNSAVVTEESGFPTVEKRAPHRNFQIKNRTLRQYTSATHYPLFDVTPKATSAAPDKWQASYTVHSAGTITAGSAAIDWLREDATTGTTITVGADYEKLGDWLTANHSTAAVGDTIMLTVFARNACNLLDSARADSIPIVLTDKYSLAYIVTGSTSTRKFYDITATDISDPLYTNLCALYNVTPVSAYADYDYTNYEPYDLLLLTDYPKATGNNSQPDYVNALADLVDRKPILSLKAHMAALDAWQTKGFTSNPVVPGDGTEGQAQLTLTVLCFSHDMFEGATWDNEELRTLTILTQAYKDGNTFKGIQGFPAISSSNFVNIAKIYDAKGDRNLVACCERQDVAEARFIMLSVNQGATQYINNKGTTAIDKLLTYLLWTDAAKVSDCSLTFDNGEGDCSDCVDGKREFTEGGITYTSGNHQWSNPANWNAKARPTQLQNVRIEANCIVSGNIYGAGNIRIKEGKTLTITPDGGLASVGHFAWYSGTGWYNPQTITTTNYITIQADADKTGMLMHSHTDPLPATVQMWSPASYEGGVVTDGHERNWTYVGIPVQAGTVPEIFNGAYTYLWSEKDGWTRYKAGSTFQAFDGIALAQPSQQVLTFAGNLALAQEYNITLTNGGSMNGMNLIGNSWTAPIQITKMDASDFGEGLETTVYIYGTGRDPDGGPAKSSGTTVISGYWTAIPIESAKTGTWGGPKIIPAMQAFEVNFKDGATQTSAKLRLDYNTIVRASGVDYSTINQKLYAPGRGTAEILNPDPSAPAAYNPTTLRISVADTAACYTIHLLQGERFTEGFDNGWDGYYMGTDGRVPGLCALSVAGQMQVSAQPEIDNTTLAFTAGKSDTYTLSFSLFEAEDDPLAETLYLNDMQLRKSCPIDNLHTYTFQTGESDMENRFVISHIAFEDQDTPTGIADLATVDQQLLLNNPAREMLTIRIYDPAGKLCSEQQTDAPLLQLSLPTTQGVYMLYITGEHTQILRKAIQ